MIYLTDDDKMQRKNIIKNNDKILFTDQDNIIIHFQTQISTNNIPY